MLPLVIPLFPLPNVVLFPHMPMPLHIFERRYRKMLADAMDSHRVIGMVLLRPGWEADYEGRPPVYPSGCAGQVEQCERVGEGRFNILLRGRCRFRIVEEHEGQPYRLARVESQPESLGDGGGLDETRRRVIAAIGKGADGPSMLALQPELPHELFVNALCQSLPLTPVERQSLLDCDTLESRCARLLSILEFKLLEQTYGRKRGESLH
jgi:uncharacterized protein